MGAQSTNKMSLESKKEFYEKQMIKEGENYLMYKYYHLGEPSDFKKLIHLGNLHKAYSSKDCDVQNFINKQMKPDHNYTNVKNERRCEELDICYNK